MQLVCRNNLIFSVSWIIRTSNILYRLDQVRKVFHFHSDPGKFRKCEIIMLTDFKHTCMATLFFYIHTVLKFGVGKIKKKSLMLTKAAFIRLKYS